MRYRNAQQGQSSALWLSKVFLLGFLGIIFSPLGMLIADTRAAGWGEHGLALPAAALSATGFGLEEVIQVAAQPVQAGATGRLTIDLVFPDGYHLNPLAPLRYRIEVSGTGIGIATADRHADTIAPLLPLRIPFQAAAGAHQTTLDIAMTFYFCREDDTGVCAIQSVRWQVPLYTVSDGTAVDPVVSYQADAPVLRKS
jgi:hypothetical protein